MKSIINSLGSNYSAKFVGFSLKSIFVNSEKNSLQLKEYLETKYNGQSYLFYKGRDAIQVALKVLLEPKSEVLTQAFSCYAVEEGIVKAGMKPVYVDIKENGTNLDLVSLKRAFVSNPNAKAVLVQHSLGVPSDVVGISSWCKKNNLVLIEDLAQGVGGKAEDRVKGKVVKKDLGSFGDVVIFSFGRDKILDAVSGGAVVFKKLTSVQKKRLVEVLDLVSELPFKIVLSDLLYPVTTFLIRNLSAFGIGKALFHVAKFLGLLSSPILSKTKELTTLHPAYSALVLFQISGINKQLEHRKKIANIYFEELSRNKSKALKVLITKSEIENGSNLRFPIAIDTVSNVLAVLKNNRIHLSDRWYREAVDCGKFKCKTAYKTGSCKNAEVLAGKIINLPTHREVTVADAKRIIKIVRQID